MTLPVTFHTLAEDELNEAASYYEFERRGLGLAFVEAVRATVAQITAFPQAAKLITQSVRRKNLHGFPYSVLYKIKTNEIRVLAIMHQKRQPLYWRGRR